MKHNPRAHRMGHALEHLRKSLRSCMCASLLCGFLVLGACRPAGPLGEDTLTPFTVTSLTPFTVTSTPIILTVTSSPIILTVTSTPIIIYVTPEPTPTSTEAAEPSETPSMTPVPSASVTPVSKEVCDGEDNNGDGAVDEGFDQDSDTFLTCKGDCADEDDTIYPNASEACNGLDDDCDGIRDGTRDASGVVTLRMSLAEAYWFDGDGDTYGGPVCAIPEGGSPAPRRGDCDDSDNQKYPGSTTSGKDCCQRPGSGVAAYVCIGASPNYASLSEAYTKVEDEGQIWVMTPEDPKDVYISADECIILKTLGIFAIEPGEATLRAPENLRIFKNLGSTVTVDGVHLTGNGTGQNGGIVDLSNGTTLIQNSTLSNGSVGMSGGAVYIHGGSLTLKNVWVKENYATGNGGAIVAESSDILLQNVRLSHNRVDGFGGGIRLLDASLTAENLILFDNYAAFGGGALSLAGQSSAEVTFSAIVGNGASGSSGCESAGDSIYGIGGIYLEAGASLTLTHSILSGNLIVPNVTDSPEDWSMQDGDLGWNVAQCNGSSAVHLSYVNAHFTGSCLDASWLDELCTGSVEFGIAGSAFTVDETWQNVEPIFSNTYPGDLHLATSLNDSPVNSTLINAGFCSGEPDPDETDCDLGPYGGPGADQWDLDLDGYPDWFWPGTWSDDSPDSVTPSDFDSNDLDPSTHAP